MASTSPDHTETACASAAPVVVARLVSLRVIDGIDSTHGWHWEVQSADRVVVVEAVTDPPNAAGVVWSNAGVTDNGMSYRRNVARSAVGIFTVTARLNSGPQSVTIRVVDLTALASPLPPVVNQAGTFKAYVSAGQTTTVTATTNAADADTWALIDWRATGVAGADDHLRNVGLDAAGDVQVTARLGQLGPKEITVTVHRVARPVLALHELEFSGGVAVNRDFRVGFDRKWKAARVAARNTRLCYARGSRISVEAALLITTRPTEDEPVSIRGRAAVGAANLTWQTEAPIAVPAVDDDDVNGFQTAVLESDVAIPNTVNAYDDVTITWEQSGADGVWVRIGDTVHPLYATYAAPTAADEVYWTLVDFSCRAAAGRSTEADVIRYVFEALGATIGNDHGLQRKLDNERMTYYGQGLETPPAQTIRDLLYEEPASGRCMAWGRFLVATYALHGIAAEVFGVESAVADAGDIVVKNVRFDEGTEDPPLTHSWLTDDMAKEAGLPGQGKTNPVFCFSNHVLVRCAGRIYDPSYGTGPYADEREWETAALAGHGMADVYSEFEFAGADHLICQSIGPGMIVHKVAEGETLDQIVAARGVASVDALLDMPCNAALKAKIVKRRTDYEDDEGAWADDEVMIPRTVAGIRITRNI